MATFAYCEWWLVTKIPDGHRGDAIVEWGYAIIVNFSFLATSSVVLIYILGGSVFPDSYFAPQRFEREGKIYRRTGILLLVAFFRFTGYERLMRKSIPVRNDLEALRYYSEVTRGSEANHVLAGICTVVLTISMGPRYPLHGTEWLWITNVLVNVYPVMLQRYNRPRVERIIRRLERNSKTKCTEPSDPDGAVEVDGL